MLTMGSSSDWRYTEVSSVSMSRAKPVQQALAEKVSSVVSLLSRVRPKSNTGEQRET